MPLQYPSHESDVLSLRCSILGPDKANKAHGNFRRKELGGGTHTGNQTVIIHLNSRVLYNGCSLEGETQWWPCFSIPFPTPNILPCTSASMLLTRSCSLKTPAMMSIIQVLLPRDTTRSRNRRLPSTLVNNHGPSAHPSNPLVHPETLPFPCHS